jgi:hypothetical protein
MRRVEGKVARALPAHGQVEELVVANLGRFFARAS